MKTYRSLLMVGMILGAFSLASCQEKAEEELPSTYYDAVETEMGDSAPEAGDAMRARVDDYESRLETLRDQIGQLPEGARSEMVRELESLEQETKLIREKMAQIEEAGEQTRQGMREDLETALSDLEQRYHEFSAKVQAEVPEG